MWRGSGGGVGGEKTRGGERRKPEHLRGALGIEMFRKINLKEKIRKRDIESERKENERGNNMKRINIINDIIHQ